MNPLNHRLPAYSQLAGRGLEIGALHEPAQVPAGVTMKYFDAITEGQAAVLFPEIDPTRFVHVDYIGDLDRDGLAQFQGSEFDFVIINHVLEHVANPIRTIEEVFRIVRPGGFAVIGIPDKRFTFDRERADTTAAHLWSDYDGKVDRNSDEHYLDFLRNVAPHVFLEPAGNLVHHLNRSRDRREHAHVWTSATFRALLESVFSMRRIDARCVYESVGDANQIEYLGLWQRAGGGRADGHLGGKLK
jgi:SAM-dependent methyltransferase